MTPRATSSPPTAALRSLRVLVAAALVGVVSLAPDASAQAPAPSAPSAPDLARGRQAYVMCATCHGAAGEGQPAIDAPAIGGQSAAYIERQLRDYRAGRRGSHPEDLQGQRMRMLARSVPDEALPADIAAHVASLPGARSDHSVKGRIQVGRVLYRERCATCHGAAGEGRAELGAPRVAGLGDRYTLSQLEHYRKAWRASPGNPEGQQMTEIARSALKSPQSSADIVAYLATLAP